MDAHAPGIEEPPHADCVRDGTPAETAIILRIAAQDKRAHKSQSGELNDILGEE